MVLFQLTMMGLFFLKGSYVLGGLVIPLIALTFLFRYILNRAYKRNASHVPMQLLRDNLDKNGKLIRHSDSSEDESSEDEDVNEAAAATQSDKNSDKEAEKNVVRNRWKRAAFTAVNMKRTQELQLETAVAGSKPKKVLLDEDDYRAVPDKLTDYRQPPMELNPGLLDTGLKTYGNPLLIGHLPQLWLPVKMPDSEDDRHQAAEKAHQKKREFLQRSDTEDGGLLAQHMADILRKVELTKLHKTKSVEENNAESALIEESRKTAHQYAASIVTERPTNPKIKALRRLFKKGAINKRSDLNEEGGDQTPAEQFRLQHVGDEIDQIERGERNNSDDASIACSVNTVHHTYYHHPERRRSHQVTALEHQTKSSPAVISDDREPKATDLNVPENNLTRIKSNKRSHNASSPAINRSTNDEQPHDILQRLRNNGRLNSSPALLPVPQTENVNEEADDNPLQIVSEHDKNV